MRNGHDSRIEPHDQATREFVGAYIAYAIDLAQLRFGKSRTRLVTFEACDFQSKTTRYQVILLRDICRHFTGAVSAFTPEHRLRALLDCRDMSVS
jgi:hypothetical protein